MTAPLPIPKKRLEQIIDAADEVIAALSGEGDIHPEDNTGMVAAEVRAIARFALAAYEQVPVSFDELRTAVFEMTGGRPTEWSESTYKGHQEVPFINFNSLARIVEKFRTHPAPSIPAVPDEKTSRELFEAWCTANLERNKWHPEIYAHLPAREQWAAWNACLAAMLNGGKS